MSFSQPPGDGTPFLNHSNFSFKKMLKRLDQSLNKTNNVVVSVFYRRQCPHPSQPPPPRFFFHKKRRKNWLRSKCFKVYLIAAPFGKFLLVYVYLLLLLPPIQFCNKTMPPIWRTEHWHLQSSQGVFSILHLFAQSSPLGFIFRHVVLKLKLIYIMLVGGKFGVIKSLIIMLQVLFFLIVCSVSRLLICTLFLF